MNKILTLTTAALVGFSLSACGTVSKRLGLTKEAPNEFNILTKAPLIVPPEYNLRPPRIGESSEENNYSQQAAREALMGDIDSTDPSQGELVLMSKAGAPRADQEIRMRIDGQNSVERKTDGFANRVLFWRDGSLRNPDGSPLDPESEAARLKSINSATGGGEVTISRRPGSPKLPGL